MHVPYSPLDRVVRVARWVARLVSAALAIGCSALLIAGLSSIAVGGPSSPGPWAFMFLVLAVVGAMLAWPWEGLGGVVLTVVGVYALIAELRSGVMDAGPWLFLGLGVIFLACWGYSLLPLKRTAPLKAPHTALPIPPQPDREPVSAGHTER